MVDWKRWCAWLRAVHRDVGYLVIGFTVIYAVSGIVQNHIEDWGDVSYVLMECTVPIALLQESEPIAVAVVRVVVVAGIGELTSVTCAGDELCLEYVNGEKVIVIVGQVIVQLCMWCAFIGLANWLYKVCGKKVWKYIVDFYVVFLFYLVGSGIFMIKGRLGFKWCGVMLIGVGVMVSVFYVMLVGGLGLQKMIESDECFVKTVIVPSKVDDLLSVLKLLLSDDDDAFVGSVDKVVPVQFGVPK